MSDLISEEHDAGTQQVAQGELPPSVEEHAPLTDPVPEPVATPTETPAPEVSEPEPEPEQATPSWLYGEPETPANQDAAYQQQYDQRQQQQYYQPPPAAWQQQVPTQQPQPQQGMSDQMLEEFVRNPESVINRMVEQRLNQTVAPMAQGFASVQHMAQAAVRAQADSNIRAAESNIKDAYKNVFSKDAAFMGNKGVRGRAEGYMQQQWQQAMREAQTGNFSRLSMMNSPHYAEGVLALSKILEGQPVTSGGTASQGNAVVGTGSRRAEPAQDIELSPDMEAAMSRLGPNGRERYLAGLREAEKYGDIEFS